MQKIYKTKIKDQIMEYIQSHEEENFTAHDIHTYMEEHSFSMNLATIYRNLDKLTESGILMKYKSNADESSKYQYINPKKGCNEHLHMQCKVCGKLLHLNCDFMKEITAHLLKYHNFILETSGSLLSGICEECRAKEL